MHIYSMVFHWGQTYYDIRYLLVFLIAGMCLRILVHSRGITLFFVGLLRRHL